MNYHTTDMKKMTDEFTIYANSLLKERGVYVTVNIVPKHGSLTFLNPNSNGKQGTIYLDPTTPKAKPSDNPTLFRLEMMGLLNHEIGHLLFSDMKRVPQEQIVAIQTRQAITQLTKEHADTILEDSALQQELFQLFRTNIYMINLKWMLNSLEDAAVEVLMPGVGGSLKKRNRVFASISAIRNDMAQQDQERLLKYQSEMNSDVALRAVRYEIHQIGVIGYRRKLNYHILPLFYDDQDIEEIEHLCLYSKFNTASTNERLSIAKLLLEKMSDLIDEKANAFLSAYLQGIAMSKLPSDMLSSMVPDEEEPSEMSINMPNINPSKGTPNNQRSEYEYDIPEDEKQKIEEQMEKDHQEEGDSQNDADSNTQNDSSTDTQNDSNSDKENDGNNDAQEEGKGEKSSKEENGSSDDEEGSENEQGSSSSNHQESDDPSNGQQGNQKSDDSDNNASQEDTEQGDSSGKDDTGTSEHETGANGVNDEPNNSASSTTDDDGQELKEQANESRMPLPDFKELEKMAKESIETIVQDDMKKEQARAESELKTQTKELQSSHQQGCQGLGKCPIEAHKGVTTQFIKITSDSWVSEYGKRAFKMVDQTMIANTATLINQIKMYAQRATNHSGLRSGKLKNQALHRALSDGKCFHKRTPGKKKNMRISLLIDLSGSMNGKKCIQAIAAAYMLASACIRSRIPVSVWGHHVSQKMKLYQFLDFNEKTGRDLRKILTADSGGCNRDGLAIFHVAQNLATNRKKDEQEFLFVISDGSPSDNGYCGRMAEQDSANIIAMFKKLYQIETIGLAIEMKPREIESCKRIYGENTIVVNDSNELPKQVVELLKELVRD